MHCMENSGKTRGFTLVEILIVVVVIGILAAIVVPQFTDAASQARATSMHTQLISMRNQIEVYRVRNSQSIPGGNSGSVTDVWNALINNDQIQVNPSTVDGFVWQWDPSSVELSLDYDPAINSSIPDADGDGDGDQDDVTAIQNW